MIKSFLLALALSLSLFNVSCGSNSSSGGGTGPVDPFAVPGDIDMKPGTKTPLTASQKTIFTRDADMLEVAVTGSELVPGTGSLVDVPELVEASIANGKLDLINRIKANCTISGVKESKLQPEDDPLVVGKTYTSVSSASIAGGKTCPVGYDFSLKNAKVWSAMDGATGVLRVIGESKINESLVFKSTNDSDKFGFTSANTGGSMNYRLAGDSTSSKAGMTVKATRTIQRSGGKKQMVISVDTEFAFSSSKTADGKADQIMTTVSYLSIVTADYDVSVALKLRYDSTKAIDQRLVFSGYLNGVALSQAEATKLATQTGALVLPKL